MYILLTNYHDSPLQQVSVDNIDLQIIGLLARDCRVAYRDIASAVGISTNATKVRINKMVSNRLLQTFGGLFKSCRSVDD